MVHEKFNPVRTGWLELTRLAIVDAFGQTKEYTPVPQLIVAASLAAPDKEGPPVYLPPRLAQPAALRVHWIGADSGKIERGDKPVASPIFGWVVPNYLEGSLHLYSADGAAIGSMIAIEGALQLMPSPTNPGLHGRSVDDILAGMDSHLRGFITALRRKPADYLVDFLTVLIDADSTNQPARYSRNPQLPVLVGQPLALARAAAWLELMGAPAINESWEALKYSTTNGYEAVQFPFLLGNVLDPDDGLFGFFIEGGEDPYGTFHIVGLDENRPGFRHRELNTLCVTAAGEKLNVTMLIDPRAEIHITAGHMPAAKLEIPPAMFRDALAALAVTFLTAPVLTTTPGGQPVSIPLPLPGLTGTWQWARKDGEGPAVLLEATTPKPGTAFGDAVYLQEGWLLVHPK